MEALLFFITGQDTIRLQPKADGEGVMIAKPTHVKFARASHESMK